MASNEWRERSTGLLACATGIASGTIAGVFGGYDYIQHGYLRAPDGMFTLVDAPRTTGGTWIRGINSRGEATGSFIDANSVSHAYVQAPAGRFTIFDVPGGVSTGSGSINKVRSLKVTLPPRLRARTVSTFSSGLHTVRSRRSMRHVSLLCWAQVSAHRMGGGELPRRALRHARFPLPKQQLSTSGFNREFEGSASFQPTCKEKLNS